MNRVQQLGRLGVLDQEAAGAGLERFVDVLVTFEGGEDQDFDAGHALVGTDPPGCLQTIDAGHPDVHQHDVGAMLACERDGLGAVFGLTDDFDVVSGVQQHAKAGADQRLIVGEQDADHDAAKGSRA